MVTAHLVRLKAAGGTIMHWYDIPILEVEREQDNENMECLISNATRSAEEAVDYSRDIVDSCEKLKELFDSIKTDDELVSHLLETDLTWTLQDIFRNAFFIRDFCGPTEEMRGIRNRSI